MGDSDIRLYFLVASLIVVVGAVIAFVIACRSRRRVVRIGVGIVLLAVATVCTIISLLGALLVAAMGVSALVLASRTPQVASSETQEAPEQ